MNMWIAFRDANPGPNCRIAIKGFRRGEPDEEFLSPDVYVDADGLFATSTEIEDTHWCYVEPGQNV